MRQIKRVFRDSGLVLLCLSLLCGMSVITCAQERATSQLSNSGQDDVQLSVNVEPKVAQVAEPMRLTLQLDAPKGTVVKFPPFALQRQDESGIASELGRFEIRDVQTVSELPINADGSRRRWTLALTLESIYVGEQTIPSLDIQYRVPGGSFRQVSSEPVKVRIASLTEDRISPEEYRDIKSVVDVDVPQQEARDWIWWSFGAVAGIGMLAGAMLVVINRRPVMSPAEWALTELSKLEAASDSIGPDDSEAFYGQLIAIVQEFAVMQFGLSAGSRDSSELLHAITVNPSVTPESRDILTGLLASADNIRFARYGFDQQETRRSIEQARQFVTDCDANAQPMNQEAA